MVRVADIHELDEAQRVATSAEVIAKCRDLVVVYAALDDGVDFDWQTEGRGGIDPAEDATDLETFNA